MNRRHPYYSIACMIALAITLLCAANRTLAADATTPTEPVLGQWTTSDGEARIEISHTSDGKLQGKIVWLLHEKYPADDPDASVVKHDRKNPITSLRDRPVLGLTILRGFTATGTNTWEDGTIYDPKSGKTYKCTMKLADPTHLDVRGYIGISLIGRTEKWVKYQGE